MILLLIIIIGILALCFILLFRTFSFKSKQIFVEAISDLTIDEQLVAEHLAQAIQFETISHQNPAEFKSENFIKFHEYLKKIFPLVHANLKIEVINKYSLLYEWKGQNEDINPVLLMSHIDVVPIEPGTAKKWNHPPFGATITDGYIWGRGTLDDKCGVIGLLEAVENLLRQGFNPQRTIYLSFGHDEEIGGSEGTAKIVESLKSRKIKLEFVLDEGSPISSGMIPEISKAIAFIGISEKGYLSLELIAQSIGGHSSKPPLHTTVGILSTAIHKLERNQMPYGVKDPVRKMFEYLRPEMPFIKKMIFSNLWLFGPLVINRFTSDPTAVALIRTTTAATMFKGGIKENILPSEARAVVNFRILPGDDIAKVINHVRKIINNPHVQVRPLKKNWNPSKVSNIESESFEILQKSIRQIFKDVIVAPFLVIGATDSRYFSGLTDNIYHFLPVHMLPGDIGMMHGTNERISITDFRKCIEFYVQLIRNSSL